MDARQYAPATQRNREPILEVLAKLIPENSNVLEIASGTGEHGVFFAQQLKFGCWIPSDPNPESRSSIIAWKNCSGLDNLELPLSINVTQPEWQEQLEEKKIDVVVNINMIHISPWSACFGLISGVSKLLSTEGILYLYGPFKRNGKHTAPSNANFDLALRDRNSDWGIRDLEQVIEVAALVSLELQEVIEMPANNLSVVFSHQAEQ